MTFYSIEKEKERIFLSKPEAVGTTQDRFLCKWKGQQSRQTRILVMNSSIHKVTRCKEWIIEAPMIYHVLQYRMRTSPFVYINLTLTCIIIGSHWGLDAPWNLCEKSDSSSRSNNTITISFTTMLEISNSNTISTLLTQRSTPRKGTTMMTHPMTDQYLITI